MTACIVGWAHTPFGSMKVMTSNLISQVPRRLSRMCILPEDIDEIVLGPSGRAPQGFPASLVLQSEEAWRQAATRGKCLCDGVRDPSSMKTIAAKQGRFVLVVGVER